MINQNIILEVKKLNLAIGKYLFETHSRKNIKIPPSPLQTEILSILLQSKKALYIKDIQKRLLISKAAVAEAIDKMERKGYIKKEPCKSDLRKIEIKLLDEGKTTYIALNKNIKKVNEVLLENISQKEMEDFLGIIHKIEKNIRKKENNDKVI